MRIPRMTFKASKMWPETSHMPEMTLLTKIPIKAFRVNLDCGNFPQKKKFYKIDPRAVLVFRGQ